MKLATKSGTLTFKGPRPSLFVNMSTIVKKVLRSVPIVAQFACIVHCIGEFIGNGFVCSGFSMEPTLHPGDVIITNHFNKNFKRGDIVTARSPINPNQLICKRIVALSGDKVNNRIFVPKGHVWLAGDNHSNSMDSSTYGPVPQALIRGKVVCRVWPFSTAKMLTANHH